MCAGRPRTPPRSTGTQMHPKLTAETCRLLFIVQRSNPGGRGGAERSVSVRGPSPPGAGRGVLRLASRGMRRGDQDQTPRCCPAGWPTQAYPTPGQRGGRAGRPSQVPPRHPATPSSHSASNKWHYLVCESRRRSATRCQPGHDAIASSGQWVKTTLKAATSIPTKRYGVIKTLPPASRGAGPARHPLGITA